MQQLMGQKDYLSKRKAGQDDQSNYYKNNSKRSLWNKVLMRSLKSQGTVNTVAYHDEDRERSLPEGDIRATMYDLNRSTYTLTSN